MRLRLAAILLLLCLTPGSPARAEEVPFCDHDRDQSFPFGDLIRKRIGLKLLDQAEANEAFGPLLGPAVGLFDGDGVTDRKMWNSPTAEFLPEFRQGRGRVPSAR